MTKPETEDLTANRDYLQALLDKGHGRAVLFLRDHDPKEYRSTIHCACLIDMRYDPQTTDSHGRFLFDILQATGEPGYYRPHILSSLAAPDEGESGSQLLEIACHFAAQGDAEARDAVYRRFSATAAEGDFTGGDDLVRLDGLSGFLHVTDAFCQRDISADQAWLFDFWLDALKERDGEQTTTIAVREAASSRPELAEWLARNAADQSELKDRARRRHPPLPLRYEELMTVVVEAAGKERKAQIRLSGHGRRADSSTIARIAADLITEQDPDRLYALLCVFKSRVFPLDPSPLIALTEHDDEDIVHQSLMALSNVPHPDVRQLALRFAALVDRRTDASTLLRGNFQPGDETLLTDLLKVAEDKWDLHRIGLDIIHILDRRQDVNYFDMLTLLYEKGPCSYCRQSAVRRLAKKRLMPDWMQQECRYDADETTRKIARFYPSRPPSRES